MICPECAEAGQRSRQVTTNWYRNPDGPDAADMIEALSRRPAMEAVAWRCREKGQSRWWVTSAPMTQPEIERQQLTVQALAVIPTQGGEG